MKRELKNEKFVLELSYGEAANLCSAIGSTLRSFSESIQVEIIPPLGKMITQLNKVRNEYENTLD